MAEDCKNFVMSACVLENEAKELDQKHDSRAAIAKYEESQALLQQAIDHSLPHHAEDRPRLVQHRQEILTRIQHLKSGAPKVPVEDQIHAVQLAMQATTAASQAATAAGGLKQMGAVAAVGAVGGAIVLGGTLGLGVIGAVGGAAAAGVAATRSDQAREMDREHDISGKVMQAGSKAITTASTINEQYHITDKVSSGFHAAVAKAQEVEEKHHVTSKVASGVAFGLSKAAQGFDKLTEAASRRSQIEGAPAGGTGA
ncbi:unnamed protein product [Effrenium voratum]|uniref:Uncharacterized protein n=1 Tax=Effrenium voratum TaxID=2562239 RepID=A0AA36MTA6_9DINO|nr:unnamed protein product [Effrenium voratum]CAJ1447252.1 unnamed protein product [Effrenium voratum]